MPASVHSKFALTASLCLLFCSSFVPAAHASTITSGTWYEFGFSASGPVYACPTCVMGLDPDATFAGDPPYTFTMAGAGNITVLDGFNSGDSFSVYDFGSLLGNTSATVTGLNCGSDISLCLATPEESRGVFALGAGDHSITINVLTSPSGGGAAFLEFAPATSTTPEPSSLALLGTGLLGAVGLARRRLAGSRA